jgi:hypothetical protein
MTAEPTEFEQLFGEDVSPTEIDGSQAETQTVSGRDTFIQYEVHNEKTDHLPSPSLRSANPLSSEPKFRQRTRPTTSPESEETSSPVAAAPSSDPRAAILKTVEQAKAKTVETRRQRADAAKQRDSGDAYHDTFRNAWIETYPGIACPTWTERDKGMVKSVLKARIYDNIEGRHDFLNFVTRNWVQIIGIKFAWCVKDPAPQLPSIAFLCRPKLIVLFQDAYGERRRYEQVSLMPSEEREVVRLMGDGMNRDEALLAAGKRRALSAAKTNEQETKRLNSDMIRRAEAERAKLTEERKQLLREKAALAAKANAPEAPPEAFTEIGPLDFELIDLPPVDYSKWN